MRYLKPVSSSSMVYEMVAQKCHGRYSFSQKPLLLGMVNGFSMKVWSISATIFGSEV
jgi:hypothetical protein